jgi:hypothetical protein
MDTSGMRNPSYRSSPWSFPETPYLLVPLGAIGPPDSNSRSVLGASRITGPRVGAGFASWKARSRCHLRPQKSRSVAPECPPVLSRASRPTRSRGPGAFREDRASM